MKVITQLLLALALVADAATAQTTPPETVINGKALTSEQKADFLRSYGTPPMGGDFWYDPKSGLWGVKGREAFGVLRPGHAYGTLAPTASAGTTGVFINGRQINAAEALYIQGLLGSVMPGRWWLDGATGYFGLEGNTVPVGNLFAVARARGGATNYSNGMNASGAVSSVCKTGRIDQPGDNDIDYIVGCE